MGKLLSENEVYKLELLRNLGGLIILIEAGNHQMQVWDCLLIISIWNMCLEKRKFQRVSDQKFLLNPLIWI